TCLLVMNFHIDFHHLVEIERLDTARNCSSHRVAHKVPQVMVAEEFGVLGENGTFLGLFDVALDPDQALFPSLVEKLVHHGQRFEVALFGELGALEGAHQSGNNFFQNIERICDQNCARGGPSDDQQFGRLQEHAYIAVLHQIAGHYRPEHNDDSDEDKHSSSPLPGLATQVQLPACSQVEPSLT